MTDILSRKGEDDIFAAVPGADPLTMSGVDDPRRDADGGSAPGGGRGYLIEDAAGLDWLYGGASGDGSAMMRIVESLDGDIGGRDASVALICSGRRRRQRRRQRRR